MESAADADIVRRLVDGDPSALEEAYRAHSARCRAVAFRAVGDDTLAQDAVQEAFLSLWRRRTGLVVRSAGIGPWLIVVTRNAALNLARTGARRTAREAAGAFDDATDPTELALANIQATGVREAVLDLPDDQRTVIALAYFKGKTLSEIAGTTGAPLGTVKRRAQLALARLARALGDSDL
jgi:RNA polymerase sigma-70 factor (ECF subfamily)